MTTECNVCCDDVPRRNAVVCPCGVETCLDCAKTHIVGSSRLAHCMECKVEWSTKFLCANFTKGWVNGSKKGQYRYHRKNVALDREKSKIPDTLAELPRIKLELDRITVVNDLKQEILRLRSELSSATRLLKTARRNLLMPLDGPAVPNFICPCPVDECRGMIDSVKFMCGVCSETVCRKCREPRKPDDKHKCNKDVRANLKLLRDDTKPCPTCATAIFKISGCDQMWCTQCKTAFSWNTGAIELGTIHNPHAIEWRRAHGGIDRDIDDVPCGGLVPFRAIQMDSEDANERLIMMYRVIGEIQEKLPGFAIDPDGFGKLRSQYVLNKITETKWRQSIFTKERSDDRKRANQQILITLRDIGNERFRILADELKVVCGKKTSKRKALDTDKKRKAIYKRFNKDIDELVAFINQTFTDELVALGTGSPLQIAVENGGYIWSDKLKKGQHARR